MKNKLKQSEIFVTMVIHDLRNPILSLKNGIDMAFERIKKIDQYKNHHK